MTIAQRAASRRGVAVVASLALAVGLVGSFAAPSSADEGSTGEFQGHSPQTLVVKGNFGGPNNYFEAGLLKLRVDGSTNELAYCVDFEDDIHEGDVLGEADWASSAIANRDEVERILGSYHPIGVGPAGYEIEGNNRQKAAATQAAVWHFTNGFNLEQATPADADRLIDEYGLVYANYVKILQAVADGVLPAVGGHVTLTIEGDTDVDAIPGQLIGPFTIHTSVASVDLTTSAGTTLHNEDGTAFEGPASDGDMVWLKSAEAGTATLSGVAAGVVSGERVITEKELQDMAFLVVTPTEVPASVEVTVHTPPTTSTSSTTSTTEQETTTTSSIVPQQGTPTTTSTVPITPQQGTGGMLPQTGAQTLALVALALVLLAAGIGFGVISRRSKGDTA